MIKIKSITNISTVGELKKFLKGIPDDIKIVTNDGESSYSVPLSFQYFPHLRRFDVSPQFEDDFIKSKCFDVEI